MAKKKTTGVLSKMNPTTAAVIGGAAGFGAAKLAIYGGEKLAARPGVPAIVQKTNVGTHAAAALGVVLTIFGKTPAVQGAGVGMIVTVLPEYVGMITGEEPADTETEPTTRRTEMFDVAEIVETDTDEPNAGETVQGAQYFDVLQAIQAGENFEMYN